MNAEQLRDQLVEVLATASAPITTSQARLAVTECCRRRGRPVVAEEAYPALVIPPGAASCAASHTSRAARPTGNSPAATCGGWRRDKARQ